MDPEEREATWRALFDCAAEHATTETAVLEALRGRREDGR